MIFVILAVVGLSLGSFVNALVWRLHEQAKYASGRSDSKPLSREEVLRLQQLSIATGRSMCSRCGHPLAATDLIPVLSWLWLRGKCRYCDRPIPDTPLAELLVPILLVVSYVWWPLVNGQWHWGDGVLFGLWALIMTCFTALSLYDARWFILPDRIVWPVTLLSGYFVIGRILQTEDTTLLLWAGLGAATLSGVFWLLSLLSKGAWIGWGDVKLALSLGLLVASPLNALLVIFIASITGTLVALPGMVLRRKGLGSQLPFGPHLMLATVIVFLFGSSIIQWYTGLFAS